jgi:poly(3-hydroxybutyrate) depolymerase
VADEIMNQLYSGLHPKVTAVESNLLAFDQGAYGNVQSAELADYGYVYVPGACSTTRCEVHMHFHGCTMSAELIGDYFAANSGLNEWAESNNIVVIYPQIHTKLGKGGNPYGCWDVLGYTGSFYPFKRSKQMEMVMAMANNPPGTHWT